MAAPANAQTAGRLYRVGVLSASEGTLRTIRRVVLPELSREGFIEGRNLIINSRAGPPDRMEDLAREVTAQRPDLVIAASDVAIAAIRMADPEVPLVMSFMNGDPVAAGFVENLARPGGRITGLVIFADQLEVKRLELLHEAVPGARRIAVLRGRPPRHDRNMAGLPLKAAALNLTLSFHHADQPPDYAGAFASMKETGAEALLIGSAPDFARDAAALAAAATAAGLPTICEWNALARVGCLIGYGPVDDDLRRRTADYVVKILRGASPSDLPIEGPSIIGLAVNLKTARTLGIELPSSLLARADEIIE
jgi:putative ABC transport system substrate-binding protein